MSERRRYRVTAIANDFRVFSDAFQMYAMERRTLPGEMEGPHFMPEGVGINEYFERESFVNPACIDGGYDWDGPDSHAYYGISIRPWQVTPEMCQELDEMMDNSDVNSGPMRYLYGGDRFAYILQE